MDQLLDAVADGYDDDLHAAFDRAAKFMASSDLRLTNDQKLRVALFKQATLGRSTSKAARLLDGFARLRQVDGVERAELSRDDAKEAYVELVAELRRGTDADEGGDGDGTAGEGDEGDGTAGDGEGDALGGLGGPVFSRPVMPFDVGDADGDAEGGAEGVAESIGAMDPLLEACRRGDVESRRAPTFGPLDPPRGRVRPPRCTGRRTAGTCRWRRR